jgi:hypothetical protein
VADFAGDDGLTQGTDAAGVVGKAPLPGNFEISVDQFEIQPPHVGDSGFQFRRGGVARGKEFFSRRDASRKFGRCTFLRLPANLAMENRYAIAVDADGALLRLNQAIDHGNLVHPIALKQLRSARLAQFDGSVSIGAASVALRASPGSPRSLC